MRDPKGHPGASVTLAALSLLSIPDVFSAIPLCKSHIPLPFSGGFVKIGLVGLPKSGKTTLFNALTKATAAVSAYDTGKSETNIAVVQVKDERITKLSAMYKPKKTVYATVEFADFAGVTEGSAKEDALSGALMKQIRNTDALAVVLRSFDSEMSGPADPAGELQKITDEFLLSDLIIAENRVEKIRAGYKRGQNTDALKAEEKVMARIQDHLGASKPIRELTFTAEEETLVKGYQFLTKKHLVVVVNSSEETYRKNDALMAEIAKIYRVIEFAGNFEMELSRMDDADAKAFMDDMGITESARDRFVVLAYETVGYISFFTVGEDEVRAWNIKRGQPAVEAAGAIHTDLARGFIAAECFTYDDLMTLGSERAIKDKGKFRLEGKEYVVKDGDCLSIRFNV